MHIEAKTFTSAADIIAHRKAVRSRLHPGSGVVNKAQEIALKKVQAEARKAREQAEAEAAMLAERQRLAEERLRAANEAAEAQRRISQELAERARLETKVRIKAQVASIIDGEETHDGWDDYVTLAKAARRPVYDIVKDVLARHGNKYTIQQVIGPSRHKQLVAIRHECMWEVRRQRPDMSLPAIGKKFNRDHTSILHAIHKCNERFGENVKTVQEYKRIEAPTPPQPVKVNKKRDLPVGITFNGYRYRVRGYWRGVEVSIGTFKDAETATAALEHWKRANGVD